METWDIFLKILMAFGVGLLVGIERGWHLRQEPEGSRAAGIRTFTLIGLFGGLSAYLSTVIGNWVLMAATAVVFLMIVGIYFHELAKASYKGATTEVAALLTFFLGVLATLGPPMVTIGLTMVLITVLRLKAPVHSMLTKIDKQELSAFFEMVILTALILPLAPNRGFGPGEVLNPFEIWLMVVFIQGISFFGHFAIRIWGAKAGTLLMGVLGGLASTTALTVTAAGLARKRGADQDMLAAAVAASNAVMFFRTLAIIAIINLSLVPVMAAPLMLGAAGAVVAASVFHRRAGRGLAKGGEAREAFLPPPTNLLSAFSFAIFLAIILVLTFYAEKLLAGEGVVVLAALSGIMDVDAITISLSKMAGAEGVAALASFMTAGIFIALFTNALSKTAISFLFGNKALGKRVIGVFALAGAGVVAGVVVGLL